MLYHAYEGAVIFNAHLRALKELPLFSPSKVGFGKASYTAIHTMNNAALICGSDGQAIAAVSLQSSDRSVKRTRPVIAMLERVASENSNISSLKVST